MRHTWFSQRWPTLGASIGAPELVLLHGWGISSQVWTSWLPLLRRRCNVTVIDLPGFGQSPFEGPQDCETLLDQLAQYIPKGAALLGWSLGGMLGFAFTARYPKHCAALMTIACNPKFLQKDDWLDAMPVAVFEQFQRDVAKDPETALQQFLQLQTHGADRGRLQLRELRQLAKADPNPNPRALTWGLNLLATLDLRVALSECQLPGVHLYGAADALVPESLAATVASLQPRHFVVLVDGAGHTPFLSHAELCWQHLDRLLAEANLLVRRPRLQRDKRAVAASFSRAAVTYDAAASLQRTVAETLLSKLQSVDAGLVLDLGCGTGFGSALLAAQHSVIALDLAEGMVSHGRIAHPDRSIEWVCGDAESLPLAASSLDAVYSSLALQWCEHVDAVYAELERVLRPGASAWIATLGPATLFELREAWAQVDGQVHVNHFTARAAIEQALARGTLAVVDWQEQRLTLDYTDLQELTRELKALGAHNINSGRPRGLTGRRRIQALRAAYDERRNAKGLLPATYQVWYLQLRKADA